jgi:hypothetical protein
VEVFLVYLTQVKDVVAIISSLVVIYVGLSGLRTWKKQLKGNTEYEHARKLLKVVFKIREAIQHVRNPFISASESSWALDEAGVDLKGLSQTDPEFSRKINRAVYSKRWEKVLDANNELDVEVFEAEAIWGKELIVAVDPLRKSIRELHWGIEMLLKKGDIRDPKINERTDKIIYDFRSLDDETNDNHFSKSLKVAIDGIESFIKPKMRL